LSQSKQNWFQKQQSAGRGNKRYDDSTIEQARQRVEQGESIRGVARDMGINPKTLHDRLKKWRSTLDDPTDEDFYPDAA
jgi:transposase-like protein